MPREKIPTDPKKKLGIAFRQFKVHSESLDDYFVDSEPTNRVKAESDGTHTKADVSFEQLVKGNVMPNRQNGGVKKNVNRRNS